jgi:hypothetical protein
MSTIESLPVYEYTAKHHAGVVAKVIKLPDGSQQLMVEGVDRPVYFDGHADVGDYYITESDAAEAAVMNPSMFERNFKRIDSTETIQPKDTQYRNIATGDIVNAVQWDGHPHCLDLLTIFGTQNLERKSVTIFGKDRKKTAYIGDWIIKYQKGFIHILSQETFDQFYVKV